MTTVNPMDMTCFENSPLQSKFQVQTLRSRIVCMPRVASDWVERL